MFDHLIQVYQNLSLTELLLFCLLTEVVVLATYFKITAAPATKVVTLSPTENTNLLDALNAIHISLATVNETLFETRRENEIWRDELFAVLTNEDSDEEEDAERGENQCDCDEDENQCDRDEDENQCDWDGGYRLFQDARNFIIKNLSSWQKETETSQEGQTMVVAFNAEKNQGRPFLYRRGVFTTQFRDNVNKLHKAGYDTITFKLDEQTDTTQLVNFHWCIDRECGNYDDEIVTPSSDEGETVDPAELCDGGTSEGETVDHEVEPGDGGTSNEGGTFNEGETVDLAEPGDGGTSNKGGTFNEGETVDLAEPGDGGTSNEVETVEDSAVVSPSAEESDKGESNSVVFEGESIETPLTHKPQTVAPAIAVEVNSTVQNPAITSVPDIADKTSWADEVPDDEPIVEKKRGGETRKESGKTRAKEYSRRKEEPRRSRR